MSPVLRNIYLSVLWIIVMIFLPFVLVVKLLFFGFKSCVLHLVFWGLGCDSETPPFPVTSWLPLGFTRGCWEVWKEKGLTLLIGFLCLLSALLQQQFLTLAAEAGLQLVPHTPGTSLILSPQKYQQQSAGPLSSEILVSDVAGTSSKGTAPAEPCPFQRGWILSLKAGSLLPVTDWHPISAFSLCLPRPTNGYCFLQLLLLGYLNVLHLPFHFSVPANNFLY